MNVLLELMDEGSGERLAESEVDVESLPPTFAGVETTLAVGESEYRVVAADCTSREDAARRGSVRLTLRKIVKIDPRARLLLVPSIQKEVPPLVPIPDRTDIRAFIAKDDFRQIEFVSENLLREIRAEFVEIKSIVTNYAEANGFKKNYLRSRISRPLSCRLLIAELEEVLGVSARPLGVIGAPRMIDDCFAITSVDGFVYGEKEDDAALSLAVHGAVEGLTDRLLPLAASKNLLLVNWNEMQVARAIDGVFETF